MEYMCHSCHHVVTMNQFGGCSWCGSSLLYQYSVYQRKQMRTPSRPLHEEPELPVPMPLHYRLAAGFALLK